MSPLIHVEEVSVVIAVLGGFIIIFGLVSFFVKERLYLSEALVSVIVGIILGPIALGLLDPFHWGPKDDITFEFTRIVIAIQVMCSGVALPKAYLAKEWKSLIILLLPVMTYMWAASGLIIWWIIPKINLLEGLAIAACVTPTDPILANSVVKGRFAEKHVPPHVRNLLSAESASNDGLAYPFLFLSIYLMEEVSVGKAIGKWFLFAWLYQVALSCVIGVVVGYIARKLLYLAERNRLIDKESFLVFAIALALFLMGIVSIIGSNDLFACFMAGTSFTWDDWFRKETEEAHLQEVIDMLLNLAVFVYVGTIIPWSTLQNATTEITVWRLIVCAVLILLLRRLPIVLALMRFIPAIKTYREAAFTGWFGPIGIGAIYYVSLIKRRVSDTSTLYMDVEPVVYFLVISSILVHGVTIPLVKISKRINTLNTRSLTGGTMSNQVSRLPIIGFGTELIFRPKTDKDKAPTPNEGSTSSTSPNEKTASSTPSNEEMPSSTTTIITVESDPDIQINEGNMTSTSPPEQGNIEDKREPKEENEEHQRLRIDIPQNLMDKVTKRPRIDPNDRSGSNSSKYAIWDEGDSYIIENYDGEDIHVIPSSSHNTPPQEQNRGYFSRRKNTNSTGGSLGSPGSPKSPDDSSGGPTTTKSV
ncbi:hypothetical protein RhiirA5_495269 [Rhizophagus irregularis]|uniref:Cation/H+ exchanger transmembrane domain-containing protein n=3 Tax=Rhizophagus irregularis TaxID=588596 RepID=A0A2I1EGH1_9GLOM|nr:Nha1p [Rhizophagus irregularis DAOM 197198w]PKC14601.1 hypothetical protein RhiirA5_495269 [Rhizophagus irregularis]PKC66881.1 hypothetical protein RhiirA1_441474 [Rhizophagus irregularis]PKY21228.1 hypothetical protein RhiirB3_353604 [Rhizophagus irregularis]UZO25100.1 hypothetical protein OCT59_017383 [Rhizophagus irregularis]